MLDLKSLSAVDLDALEKDYKAAAQRKILEVYGETQRRLSDIYQAHADTVAEIQSQLALELLGIHNEREAKETEAKETKGA